MRMIVLLAAVLAVMLVGAAPVLAQEVPGGSNLVSGDDSEAPPVGTSGTIVGTVTDISGSAVLVEEDPSDWGIQPGRPRALRAMPRASLPLPTRRRS